MTLLVPMALPGDEIALLQQLGYGHKRDVKPLANRLNSAVRKFRIEWFGDFHFPELAPPETSVYVNGPRDGDKHQAGAGLTANLISFSN
jgi:hypothetical protein